MKIHHGHAKIILAAVAVYFSGITTVAAQAGNTSELYPSRTVRIVVPYPPGGQTDAYARLLARGLNDMWGQPVVVENRSGASGVIGTNFVKQSAPDGYTLLFTANSGHTLGPLLKTPPPFSSIDDFTPITTAITYPMYVLIDHKIPANTVGEFIKYAKARKTELNYSSAGTGSGGHIACELFLDAAKLQAQHVPYKGSAPAQLALMAGDVQMFCDSVGNSHKLVKDGKMKGLTLTAKKRLPAAPEIPTTVEVGMPGVQMSIWLGLLAPKGLAPQTAQKIQAAVTQIMNSDEMRQRTLGEGTEVNTMTSSDFVAFMRSEQKRYGALIKDKGIKAD